MVGASPWLLGEAARQLSRHQKIQLLTSFLALLALGVFLVMLAFWMARWTRKRMTPRASAESTPLPNDLWRLRPGNRLDHTEPDDDLEGR